MTAPSGRGGLLRALERFRARATNLADRVRTSYWFVPAVLVLLAMAVGQLAVAADRAAPSGWIEAVPGLHSTEPAGARALLGTIASSTMTVASVVFSITIVALTVASGQFGSRLLRTFMAQRSTQVALGTFLATFVYALLVMRAVQSGSEAFVPEMALAGAAALTLVSLGVLIYFLHAVATSLQVTTVLSRVLDDVTQQLDPCFPPPREAQPTRLHGATPAFPGASAAVRAPASGYVRVLDRSLLLELARAHDLAIAVRRGPGRFAAAGCVLAEVAPRERAPEPVLAELRDAFALGSQRTPIQDVAFSLNQLVEIALRALSPGMHDPTTAIACLHRLGDAFGRIAGRPDPEPVERDEQGVPRLWSPVVPFEELLAEAFDRVLAHAGRHRDVWVAALDALALVAESAGDAQRRRALARYAGELAGRARMELPLAADRDRVDRAAEQLGALLEHGAPGREPRALAPAPGSST